MRKMMFCLSSIVLVVDPSVDETIFDAAKRRNGNVAN